MYRILSNYRQRNINIILHYIIIDIEIHDKSSVDYYTLKISQDDNMQ